MKAKLLVNGLSCHSCEKNIENALLKLPGINRVKVNSNTGIVLVFGENINKNRITKVINRLGYEVLEKRRILNRDPQVWRHFLISSVIILSTILLFDFLGVDISLNFSNREFSLATPIVFGLLAGLSTCGALLGGLVLGFSGAVNGTSKLEKKSVLKMNLLFNIGRVLSFIVLGGLLGTLGSSLKVNNIVFAFFVLFFGVVIFVIGLQLTEVLLGIGFRFRLPAPNINKHRYRSLESRSFMVGLLTFFVPCGFAQAMQILAISTGSFVSGATIMGLFALGTVPALFGLSAISVFAQAHKIRKFIFHFMGVLILVVSFNSIINGTNLINFRIWRPDSEINTTDDKDKFGNKLVGERTGPKIESGVNVLRAVYTVDDVIKPEDFELPVGRPAKFVIDAKEDGEGCMSTVLIPGLYNTPLLFQKGESVVMEFTPQRKGRYLIVCAMGFPAGTLLVK